MNGAAREQRRSEILAAAATEIARHGYHGMSMRDLARASHSGLASLYTYFGSKEDILFALHSRAFGELLASAEQALQREVDPVKRLHAFTRNHVHYFERQPDLLRVLVREGGAMPATQRAATRGLKDQYFVMGREILRALVERRAAGSDTEARIADEADLDRLTYSYFGMLNWIHGWYEPARHGPPELLAATIDRIVLGGVDAEDAS